MECTLDTSDLFYCTICIYLLVSKVASQLSEGPTYLAVQGVPNYWMKVKISENESDENSQHWTSLHTAKVIFFAFV